ncbi:MAG: hypothetical protein CUN55_15340 [Phototrophicales bacterium]|nr:MAG: hypothetical protein CUN55_15340 [Phototrophicales bacterium]
MANLSNINLYDVAVIGAGVAGSVLAHELTKHGLKVCVVDKARGSGGRLASKRFKSLTAKDVASNTSELGTVERNGGVRNISLAADMGCYVFAANTESFQKTLVDWMAQGRVLPNNFESDKRMSNWRTCRRSSWLTRSLLQKVDTKFSMKIVQLSHASGLWRAYTEGGDEAEAIVAKNIVLTMPPPQIALLLPDTHPDRLKLMHVPYQCQWVLPVFVSHESAPTFKAQLDSMLSAHGDNWLSHYWEESSKPQRAEHPIVSCFVLYLNEWCSRAHGNSDAAQVEDFVLDKIKQGNRIDICKIYAHRWLYAQCCQPIRGSAGYMQLDDNLYACGDGFASIADPTYEGVERAYLGAIDLAARLVPNALNADDQLACS